MSAALGGIGVVAAFAASLLGALSLAIGLVRRRPSLVETGHRFVPILAIGSVISVAAMEYALITRDFSLDYVAKNSSRSTPMLYTISGMWAALEGSILLWGLVLAGFVVAVARRFRTRRHDPLVGWAMLVLLVVSAFFFGLMLEPANPFRTLLVSPADGRGPNPLLQNHPLMAFHPPILYIGYVGFTVPFAFAVAALVTGRVGERWLSETRRWTLVAWGCLTVGIVLGSWWSYEVLGWGGFWGWDAVENASFLPWLTGTAYLHSVMVQERRGLLRVWNLSLLCATFSLTILGTFLTRSGVISSVHAFSSSDIGPWLLGFFAVVVAVSLGLIGWRGDRLRSVGTIDSPLSREGAFLANNVLFAVFAGVILLGTVFPLLVEAWNDERLSVGAPYFETMATPIGLVMLLLMAVAPALPWRKASPELLRSRLQAPLAVGVAVVVAGVALGATGIETLLAFFLGAFAAAAAVRQLVLAARTERAQGRSGLQGLIGRANGGMVVHLGVIMIAVAIAASRSYGTSTELRLKPGQSAVFDGHRVELLAVRKTFITEPNGTRRVHRIIADVRVDGGRIDRPKITNFSAAGQGIGTPSVRTGLVRDVYLTLVQAPRAEGAPAVIGVYLQPMTLWLWIGGGVIALGTVFAALPGRRRRPTDPSTAATADAVPVGVGVPEHVDG